MPAREEQVLTVAALNRAVRYGIESEWGDVLVVGEISDFTRSHAGHIYFTLNDEREQAQLRIVMFGSDAKRTRATMEDGARIRVRGRLTLYEPRGTFQMIARSAAPAGEGDLLVQFKKLLAKLEAEGLTAPERKRALPALPRCVGIVTSAHGAAIHDIIRVANMRCPVRIVVAACVVQGPDAPASITRALRALQSVPELDVVILARGGGSAEDLWAFNDERIARAIVTCRVPVVTGVGHEVDVTIADLVADVRAATPSQAAELVVPAREALEDQLDTIARRLARALETRVDRSRLTLARYAAKLRDPRHALSGARAPLLALNNALERAMDARIHRLKAQLEDRRKRLGQHDPRARLSMQKSALVRARTRLELSPSMFLTPKRHALSSAIAQLDALSPLAVLGRGYAIAFDESTGRAIRAQSEVSPGTDLRIRLHEGEIRAKVTA